MYLTAVSRRSRVHLAYISACISAYTSQAEASIPRESPADYCLKYLELRRTHLHDTITHYRALFGSAINPPNSPNNSPSAEVRTVHAVLPAGVTAGEVIGVADADGVAHLVSSPPPQQQQSDDGATGTTTATFHVASGSWGRPRGEMPPGELYAGAELRRRDLRRDIRRDALLTRCTSLHHPLLCRSCVLLSCWASERADEMSQTLHAWLPRIDEGAYIAALVEQASYCAK